MTPSHGTRSRAAPTITITDHDKKEEPLNIINRIDMKPWIVRDTEAEQVQDGTFSRLTLLADGQHTAGSLTVNRARLEAGSPGAPSHRHLHATETIFVIAGSLDVLVGEDVSALGAGDMVVLPPGTTHAFAPTSGGSADMLAVYTPGQHRFEYYRLLESLYRGHATLEDLRASSDRYDNHYVESAAWQAVHPW
jgi:mannose-6-phosphate isomerase-like protein (cupin superfamily)